MSLTQVEKKQNHKILQQLLMSKFPNKNFSINVFLDNCDKDKIWLPGLAPIVHKQFIWVLTYTLKNGLPNSAQIVYQTLKTALENENVYLKTQHLKNKGTYETQVQRDDWLEAADIKARMDPLVTVAYINSPVEELDCRIIATVETELKTSNKQVAFVPICTGSHWTLAIFQKDAAGNISKELYNPPGDGKCGHHIVDKAYKTANEVLGENINHDFTNQIKSQSSENAYTIGSYARLFKEWTIRANNLIDELTTKSDDEKAKEWNTFVQNAKRELAPRDPCIPQQLPAASLRS